MLWRSHLAYTRIKPLVLLGFQPPYFTQMLLQPSSTRSWLKPHPPINKLAIVGTQLVTTRPDWDRGFPIGNGCRAGREDCFLNLFIHRRIAVAHPEPTKVFLKLSPETAMLSAPLWCTHPPPPSHPFCFLQKQNLSPKVIAGIDITRWNFHARYIRLHPGMG